MPGHWAKLRELASAQVEDTVTALPARLRQRAQALSVTFERRPNRLQRRDGIEPDTLGLFIGPNLNEEEHSLLPLPPQIILFLENLWSEADGNESTFRKEVRTTFLHELGHFLGLDEQGLIERGLE
jgi:predicted Zn-dependent protease with MMP-like domain